MEELYEVSLNAYKDTRFEMNFASYYELAIMAREIIYYNYLADQIMQSFLHSNICMEEVINNLEIKTIEEFMETGKF